MKAYLYFRLYLKCMCIFVSGKDVASTVVEKKFNQLIYSASCPISEVTEQTCN